jgi:hypothetical protein
MKMMKGLFDFYSEYEQQASLLNSFRKGKVVLNGSGREGSGAELG